MNGSEKQITWANEIIANEKASIEKHLKNNRQRVALDGDKYPNLKLMLEAQEICCNLVLAELDNLTDAKFIIDNRGGVRRQIMKTSASKLTSEQLATIKAATENVDRMNFYSLLVG